MYLDISEQVVRTQLFCQQKLTNIIGAELVRSIGASVFGAMSLDAAPRRALSPQDRPRPDTIIGRIGQL